MIRGQGGAVLTMNVSVLRDPSLPADFSDLSNGRYDLVDFVGWQDVPPRLAGQEVHAHNRLLSSVMMTTPQRQEMARTICARLATAQGPTVLLVPVQGGNEWDRPGGPLSGPEGLRAFVEELRAHCPDTVTFREEDAHISEAALAVFDDWLAKGTARAE